MDDNYSYNTANQISNIAGLSQTRNFGYDNVDKLTSVTGSTAENFMYDAVGNRTSSSQSASYTYQPYNRLTSTATATYTYNANGSMTGKSEGSTLWRYGYDYENRLVEASTRKQTVRYRYDALGRRIQRYFIKGGKDNTKFTYDGQDVVLDNNDGVITKYQNGLGIDNKLKLTTNGTSKYFLQDHLGSTTGLTNSSGNITESTSYDSFGNASGTLSTRYSYTGREYDNFTGLYYYRARFYDAKLGRFISEDPRGFFGSYDFNNYNYCLNNPLIYRDFTGESPTLVTGAIGAGVGAIIGGSFALVSGGSWGDVAKGAAVGAVAGGVTGLTLGLAGPAIASAGGGGIIGGMIAGGVSSGAGNLAGQGLSYGLGWRCDLSPKEFGLSVGLGAAGGGFLLRPGTLPNQPVTSWASKGVPPDLNPGRWVMTGGNTLRNYGMSGTSSYAPYGNSITGNIPSSNLAYPAGWEGFKGLFGQRVIGQ
jgi:RHS repeat-associated protein